MKLKFQISHVFIVIGLAAVGYLAIKNSAHLADVMGGIDGHLPTSALGGPAIYSEKKVNLSAQNHGFQGSGY